MLGGSWVAQDGYASPVDVTAAFIKSARNRGALCLEGVKVTGIVVENGRVCGVNTSHGDIQSEFVVNCAGMWAREVGRMAGGKRPAPCGGALLCSNRKARLVAAGYACDAGP